MANLNLKAHGLHVAGNATRRSLAVHKSDVSFSPLPHLYAQCRGRAEISGCAAQRSVRTNCSNPDNAELASAVPTPYSTRLESVLSPPTGLHPLSLHFFAILTSPRTFVDTAAPPASLISRVCALFTVGLSVPLSHIASNSSLPQSSPVSGQYGCHIPINLSPRLPTILFAPNFTTFAASELSTTFCTLNISFANGNRRWVDPQDTALPYRQEDP